MDMDVRHCNKKPRLNHRPSLPEDLYTCIIAFLFRVCRIKIKDIYLSGEHEDDKYDRAHRHSPLDKVRHIVYLSRTCKRMRDEVRKNAKLDRTRAWDILFKSLFDDVRSCWAGEWKMGSQRQEYSLREHSFPFQGHSYVPVAYLCIKRTPSKLEILFECAAARCSDSKVVFCIAGADSDSDSGSDSDTDGFPDELLSVWEVQEVELATTVNAWLAMRRDSRIVN